MKKIRPALAAALAATLALTAYPVMASAEDDQFVSPFTGNAGVHGIELLENSGNRTNVSVLMGQTASGIKLCSSTTDANCSGDFDFYSVLPKCSASVTIDCIESVVAKTANGAQINGELSEYFPTAGVNDFAGSTTESIPGGYTPSVWNLPGADHSQGTLYYVAVQVQGSRVGGNSTTTPRGVAMSIHPVSIVPTDCDPQFHGTCLDQYTESVLNNGRTEVRGASVARDQDLGIRCVGWAEAGRCAKKHAFPAGITMRVTVRLSVAPSGWLHGRIAAPTASITTTNGVTSMVVEASPVRVPAVAAAEQWSTLPSSIQQWFDSNCPDQCGTRNQALFSLPGAQRNAVSTPFSYAETSFSQLELWSQHLSDKASAVPSYWSVRTLSSGEMIGAPDCIKYGTGVTGIVSTNATLYSEGPPSFDSSTKTLNYKVAAMHYEPDGVTELLGRYDLMLRPDIAQCLYGIDDLAVQSTVNVTAESGQTQAATTSMTQTSEWFTFSAVNYTHSAPTISVKVAKLRPNLKRGKTIRITSLAKTMKLSIPRGAKVTTSIAKASRKRCSLSRGTVLKGVKKGSCTLSISVTPKKTKKVKKPKTVKRTVVVTIR